MSRIVPIDKLEEGMILEENILNPDTGVILITENSEITLQLINKLYLYGIRRVKIKEDDNFIYEQKKLIDSYIVVEDQLEDIFEDVKNGKSIDINIVENDIRNFKDNIVEYNDLHSSMRLLYHKDDYTFNHSFAVSILAISFGKWANFSEEDIFQLAMGALLHDIGKLKIDEYIINKPGRLTDKEFLEMKNHPKYGYDILLDTGEVTEEVLKIVLQHHEKIDGTGYPYALRSEEIHEFAKIVAICDIYHALTSKRAYKDGMNPFDAFNIIKNDSFSTLDPYYFHLFLKNLSKTYVGNDVILSDGRRGTIIYVHPQDREKVIVKVGQDFINFLYPQKVKIVNMV